MLSWWPRAEKQVLLREPLIFLLGLTILLRIPSLFEPYWYGDENIYLTIGNGLRHGLLLYQQIVDHKTPLMYLLAMVPSLFWFKFLLLSWSMVTVSSVFAVCKKIMHSSRSAFWVCLPFVLLTTLPAFEGNIVNAELFVLGWIALSLWVLSRTQMFAALLEKKPVTLIQPKLCVAAGLLLGLAILTKVPAVFDGVGLATIFLLSWGQHPEKKSRQVVFTNFLWFLGGTVIPILASGMFFASQGSLQAYWKYAMLYNFRYAQEFSLPFSNLVLQTLFSFPGKIICWLLTTLLLIRGYRKLSPLVILGGIWLVSVVFAMLLSSRPYPHYWLQVFLPLCVLAAAAWQQHKYRWLVLGSVIFILGGLYFLFKVTVYPSRMYYARFISYALGQTSKEKYIQAFDPLMTDTYATAQYIVQTTPASTSVFVWGDDPGIYALSRRIPVGRFTTAFHIEDFQAHGETLRALVTMKPPIIVVMKNEHHSFDEFFTYLNEHYILVHEYPTLWIFRYLDRSS